MYENTLQSWYYYVGVDNMHKIKKRWWIIAILSFLVFVLDITLYIGVKKMYPDVWEKEKMATATTAGLDEQQQEIQNTLKDITIKSKYGILIDLNDGNVLYEKNSNDKIYPASLTKVLTAISALDSIHDVNEKVTITDNDLKNLIEENASVAGLEAGDEVTYEQLLYALILPSGADAANALANHLNGNTKNFVADMNNKAKAMGMEHTNFVTTTGLHDKNHYTTLQDMKKMMMHAWKNPAFRKVLTTVRYTIPNLKSNKKGLSFTSTLYSYTGDLSFHGGEIIGGKSGYTPEAECCLVSIGKLKNGHLYMFISAKAPGQPNIEHYHINDAKLVYEKIASIEK